MYCKTCEADVAAEVSADGKSLLCTTCGSEVRKSYAPSLSEEARSARELLERWSSHEEADPFADAASETQPEAKKPANSSERPTPPDGPEPPIAPVPPAKTPVPPAKKPGAIQRADVSETLSGPKLRHRRGAPPHREDQFESDQSGDLMDRPRPLHENRGRTSRDGLKPLVPAEQSSTPPEPPRVPQHSAQNNAQSTGGKIYRVDAAHTRSTEVDADGPSVPPPHRRPAPAMPDGHRLDARHDIPAPHMRTESFIPPHGKRPGRVESVAGQLLAYGGVGFLTVGTALILWGYFGGPVQYAPTGWLVATVGQMILFLGVVTLISGGMQQTTHEVGMRVADLGERLGRIEETTELALNPPHFMKQQSRATVRAGRSVETDDQASFE